MLFRFLLIPKNEIRWVFAKHSLFSNQNARAAKLVVKAFFTNVLIYT